MKNPPLQQGHDGPRAPPLRPYQADTLQRMKSYEGNAALCVIATGLGKTRIFAEYIRCDVLENDHHILILSHREELVIQPLEYLKGLPCGIEQGTTHAHGEPIISASVQSLVGRLDKYNPYRPCSGRHDSSASPGTTSGLSSSTRPTTVLHRPTAKFLSTSKMPFVLASLQPQSAVMVSAWMWLLTTFCASITPYTALSTGILVL